MATACSDAEEGDDTQDSDITSDSGGDAQNDASDAGPDLSADPVPEVREDPTDDPAAEISEDLGTDLPSEDVSDDTGLDLSDEEGTVCGDDVIEGDEQCEGTNLGAATCDDLGLAFGTPTCVECALVETGCRAVAVCNDGFIDGDETCEDGNTEPFDGCDENCQRECDPEGDSDGDEINDCDDVEECDGLDNDGDEAIDEDPVDEEIGDACYTGPEETRNIGICRDGVIACRLGELVCIDDVTPQFDELCNDLDDDCDDQVPPEEAEAGCDTDVIIGDDPFSARFEIRTPPRAVDVVLNIDTTGSMDGELEGVRTELRDVIVPGVEAVLEDAAFAVTTFEDYPFGDFGEGGDLPFELWQRVTTSIDAVQDALDAVQLGNGNDIPESGLESLYQIATGTGVRWPAGLLADIPATPGLVGYRAENDADDYAVTVTAGQVIVAEIVASEAGSSVDPYLYIYDAEGVLVASEDDTNGYDPVIEYTAEADGTHVIRVAACCGGAPTWGGGTGWYSLRVTIDGALQLPEAGTCSGLEVGVDSFAEGEAARVPLMPEDDALPYDVTACTEDCDAVPSLPLAWIGSYCGYPEGECGDGVINEGEPCDDGNEIDTDECSNACVVNFLQGVAAFDPRPGFSTALGHGRIGGVGFRAGSVPVVLQITDAVSHDGTEYTQYIEELELDPIDAHTGEEAFNALDQIGARVIGIDSGGASGDPADLTYLDAMVLRSGSVVPLCAFDGSQARTDGVCLATECCTGINGTGAPAQEDDTCPLVFEISSSGTGLSTAIVQSLETLANYTGEQYTGRLVAAAGVPEAVTCMLGELEVVDVIRPGTCLPELALADLDEDGFEETVVNATPSTRATFSFTAVNRDRFDVDSDENTTEACIDPGSYAVTFQLVDVDGDVIFAQQVNITVLPPS